MDPLGVKAKSSEEDDYPALLRAIRRRQGFGLLFVRCSPSGAEELIGRVRSTISHKRFAEISLTEGISNLYDRIQDLASHEEIDVLFVRGLEHSIYEYEDKEFGGDIYKRSSAKVYGGTWEDVPPLFAHLNLSRERFRDSFPFCIVFLVPEFVLRYFIRRAPDYFDWRSNNFVYEMNSETEAKSVEDFLRENTSIFEMNAEKRHKRLVEIKSHLSESLDDACRSNLLFEESQLIGVGYEDYERAARIVKEALSYDPQDYRKWAWLGYCLVEMGRYEEAIANYSKAIRLDPDNATVYYNRGLAKYALRVRDLEGAIADYSEAIRLNPDDAQAYNNRGLAKYALKDPEGAIADYSEAIRLNSNDVVAYTNRCYTKHDLGDQEGALADYHKFMSFNPGYAKLAMFSLQIHYTSKII